MARAAPHAHVQSEDKNRVQQDIHQCAQRDSTHTNAPKALGVDKGVHAKADHHTTVPSR